MKARRHKRFSKKTVFLVVLTMIIIGGYLIFHSLTAPSVAHIDNAVASSTAPSDPTQTTKKYDGKYVNFDYPGNLKISRKYVTDSLESTYFTSSLGSGSSETLGLIVKPEKLDDDSGYNLRKSSSAYTLASSKSGQYIFVAKNSSERAVFIVHNDLVAGLSLTSASDQELTASLQKITNSMEWK